MILKSTSGWSGNVTDTEALGTGLCPSAPLSPGPSLSGSVLGFLGQGLGQGGPRGPVVTCEAPWWCESPHCRVAKERWGNRSQPGSQPPRPALPHHLDLVAGRPTPQLPRPLAPHVTEFTSEWHVAACRLQGKDRLQTWSPPCLLLFLLLLPQCRSEARPGAAAGCLRMAEPGAPRSLAPPCPSHSHPALSAAAGFREEPKPL